MGGANGEVAVQHPKFLRLAAAGMNVFVSSGDAGSNPDQTGHGLDGPLQAEYETAWIGRWRFQYLPPEARVADRP